MKKTYKWDDRVNIGEVIYYVSGMGVTLKFIEGKVIDIEYIIKPIEFTKEYAPMCVYHIDNNVDVIYERELFEDSYKKIYPNSSGPVFNKKGFNKQEIYKTFIDEVNDYIKEQENNLSNQIFNTNKVINLLKDKIKENGSI